MHAYMYVHWNTSSFTVSITSVALFVTRDLERHADFYPLTPSACHTLNNKLMNEWLHKALDVPLLSRAVIVYEADDGKHKAAGQSVTSGQSVRTALNRLFYLLLALMWPETT